MKVLISDNLAPIGEKILREAGLEVDVKTGLPPEELKDIPVIMLTGVAGVLEEDDAQAEGDTFESPFDSIRERLRMGIAKMREEGVISPERFIDKPIDPEELIEAVQSLIG